MTEHEYYMKQYTDSVNENSIKYIAYRIQRSLREQSGNLKLSLFRLGDVPGSSEQWICVQVFTNPINSKVFIEIEFGKDILYNHKYNLPEIWRNFMLYFKDSFRKDIIGNVEIASFVYDFGDLNKPWSEQFVAEDTVDMGFGPNREGNTGPIPDFLFEHYFWQESQGLHPTMAQLIANREWYLEENETHMWPEVTMRNYNKDKNVDSRPYFSMWAIGYWKSLSGGYEIIEDRTMIDGYMRLVYKEGGKDAVQEKYSRLKQIIATLINQYGIHSKDFDCDAIIPRIYRDYERELNSLFADVGADYEFVDTSKKVYYRILHFNF